MSITTKSLAQKLEETNLAVSAIAQAMDKSMKALVTRLDQADRAKIEAAAPKPEKKKPAEWVKSKLTPRSWKAVAGPGFENLKYTWHGRVCVQAEEQRSPACKEAKGAFRLLTIASVKSLDSTEKGKRWYWGTCPDCKSVAVEQPGEFEA